MPVRLRPSAPHSALSYPGVWELGDGEIGCWDSSYGQCINIAQFTRAVRSLGRRVGHPSMTVRSLRHFYATVTLQSGQNPVVFSKRLGHSNVSITSDIYAHALPGWQRQAADAFAETMGE